LFGEKIIIIIMLSDSDIMGHMSQCTEKILKEMAKNKEQNAKPLHKFPLLKRKELAMDMNEDPIGSGATAAVFEAEYQSTAYAAKMFHLHVRDSTAFQAEVKACDILAHPHIVALRAVIVDNKDEKKVVGLLLDKMESSLLSKIKSDKPTSLQIIKWCIQVVKAMLHAHSCGVIHSDIKPENVLVSEAGVAMLSDFGSASFVDASNSTKSLRGTAQFIAPEKAQTGATFATDVFAFGMMLWRAFHPDVDFGLGATDDEIKVSLGKSTRPSFNSNAMPSSLKELTTKCWHQDPKQRPSFVEILQALNDGMKAPVASPAQAPKQETMLKPLEKIDDSANIVAQKPKKTTEASNFDLDVWKREYASKDTRYGSSKWLFENFNKEGYTMWFSKYKYNNELTKVFMTSNLVRGWFQRMEDASCRKYGAFGIALILGAENSHEIHSFWIFRGTGTELPACVKKVEDTELMDWRQIADIDAEKELITDFLCWEGKALPKPCLEGRTFK
jgi:serine/threonine protein kinase